jgi:MFS family permease
MTPSQIPTFRRYLAGRILGVLGRQIVSVTIGWEIYERTRSTWALGLVGLIQVLPVVLLSIPAGVIVDRADRRKIAAISQLGFATTSAALALVSFFSAPLWLMYVALLFAGSVQAFSAPAASSLLPRLVPSELFAQANAWSSTAFNLAAIAGPALGGFLIALTGGAVVSYLCGVVGAVSFSLVLLGLSLLPVPETSPSQDKGDWRSGLRFVFGSKLLLSALTLDMFSVLFAGVTALLPVFARDILQVGPDGLGWLRAAPSLGAFSMALIGTRLSPWKRPGRVLLLVVAGFGVVILGFGFSRSFALSLGLLFVSGALDNISVVIRMTLEQLITPDHMRGRVSAIHYVFIGLSNELGEFESGIAAGLLGPIGAVLFGGAATLAVVGAVAILSPSLVRLGPLSQLKAEG